MTDAKWRPGWHFLLLSERPPPRWRGPNLFNSPPSAADAFNLLHLCTLTLLQRRGCACCGPRRRLPAGQTTPTALLFGCTKLRVALAGAQSGYTTLLHAPSRQCQRDSPLCWPASCRRAAAVRRQRTLQRHRCACAVQEPKPAGVVMLTAPLLGHTYCCCAEPCSDLLSVMHHAMPACERRCFACTTNQEMLLESTSPCLAIAGGHARPFSPSPCSLHAAALPRRGCPGVRAQQPLCNSRARPRCPGCYRAL